MATLFNRKKNESPTSDAEPAEAVPSNVSNPPQQASSASGPEPGATSPVDGGSSMSKDPKPASAQAAASTAASIESDMIGGASLDRLDRIRDILFGREMRDYESKLAGLEERMKKDADTLREDLEKRIESLEEYMKKELESLVSKLKAEQKKREDEDDGLKDRLKETSTSIDRRHDELEEKVSDNHRELREQVLAQSKSLNEEIRRRGGDLEALVDRHVNDLRSDKMDRAALAALLKEMSMRINRELDSLELQ